MRDFLPDDVRRRNYVVGVIRDVYERYGFEPLETPAVENIETLLGKYGDEGNKLIFKILKRGEHEASGQADLALRYDLTVPLARVVAEHQGKLPKFFKRYQVQPVWRADRPARGRFREFYQCDVDVIGSTSPIVEVEVCAAASEVLARLGFERFVLRLNHRNVLKGMLDAAGIPAEAQDDALVAIDKLDKIGVEAVVGELVSRGVAAERAQHIMQAVGGTRVSNDHTLETLRTVLAEQAAGTEAVNTLATILKWAEATAAKDRIEIDPSLARGLSYYTGAIMEISVPDLAGSLGGGGRYDNLVGMFLGRDVPACGFSLGLERILVVMGERNMFPEDVQRAGADVMVTLWSEQATSETLKLASELRRAALRVDVYPEPGKIGKQFKYASERGVRFVAILGDDEMASGNVAIKNLTSGEQVVVRRDEAPGYVRDAVHGRRA
jgi:histidyl-tRNA synthetase